MPPRAIVALGIGQCVNWGVLYYAFAVLVRPLERELGVSTWVVTGAFSLGLLMSAALAPTIGRWGDRDRGALVMQAGGFTAAALLLVWTLIPGVVMLYLVWAGLGLCMAATLYEPAFVIVGRACDEPTRRLRALAAVTLFGGLASTVFLPLTALLVAAIGWRGAILVLAGLVTVSTCITRAFVFRDLPQTRPQLTLAPTSPHPADGEAGSRRFPIIAAMFALASQQLARAAGPLAIAWLAGPVGYATVFAVIAGTFTVVALASHGVLDGIQELHIQKETI